jgi:hypothetical protein
MNLSMIYLVCYKNFCKCHNIPPSTTIKKKDLKHNNTRSMSSNQDLVNMPAFGFAIKFGSNIFTYTDYGPLYFFHSVD